MGEILCHNCGAMYWHINYHNNEIRWCANCNSHLGRYCLICREWICDSCYTEHADHEEIYGV